MITTIPVALIATIVSIVDGDTIKVNLPCDQPIFCKAIPVRVGHLDTPEIHGQCPEEKDLALKARAITASYFAVGSKVELVNPRRDQYFRIDADFPELEQKLISMVLAKPYEGGKKKEWCNE
jgi:endonuclease YncB( thermonuclease family)